MHERLERHGVASRRQCADPDDRPGTLGGGLRHLVERRGVAVDDDRVDVDGRRAPVLRDDDRRLHVGGQRTQQRRRQRVRRPQRGAVDGEHGRQRREPVALVLGETGDSLPRRERVDVALAGRAGKRALPKTAKTSNIVQLDLLNFDKKYICTHLADIGINAKMIKNYKEQGEKGMIGYAKYLFQSIKESPLLSYTIKTPDKVYEKEGYMLVIGNANMYGTGIRISEGSVSDGKFEICNVPKIALDEAIKAGLTKFNVFLDEDMFADVISCTSAEIKINQLVDFQIDGEYMGEVDRLQISILPSAIPVLIN